MLAVKNSQIIRQKCLKPEIHQLGVHRVCSVLHLNLSGLSASEISCLQTNSKSYPTSSHQEA